MRASVSLLGAEPSSVTYDDLLTILDTYGYTALDSGSYVRIIPDAMVRFEPVPMVTDSDKRPADEYVTTVIHVKSLSAAELVPILRPMMSRQAHFAALPCSNDLVMVARFSNVRRIESVIKAMDKGTPLKLPGCAMEMSGLWQPPGPPMRTQEQHPRAY